MIRPSNATASGKRARVSHGGQANPDLNGLLAEPRRMKILARLQEGSARVRDLSVAFGVSEATIRQDLEKLELMGTSLASTAARFFAPCPCRWRIFRSSIWKT